MHDDELKAIARAWFERVINERDVDAIDEVYAEGYVHHGNGDHLMRGREEAKAFAAALLGSSNDRHATVEEQLVDGERVATRFVSRGTHTGPLMGVAPTGRELVVRGIVISRIVDGQIVEDWEYTDVPLAIARLRGDG